MVKVTGLSFGKAWDVRVWEWGFLFLRAGLALLMLRHGYEKLVGFPEMAPRFFDPFGLSAPVSLALVVGSEFFGALFVLVGFLTRWSSATIVFTMLTAAFMAHGADPFAKKELALIYALGFFYFMCAGGGKLSVDHRLKKFF